MASEHVNNITDADWQSEVLDSGTPVLIDFWSETCPPCRALAPVIDQIAEDTVGKLKVTKLDVGNNREVASQIGITTIPQLLLYKGGEEVARVSGFLGPDKAKYLAVFQEHLD